MPSRWNTWTSVQSVQLDYEKTPKERPIRLTGPTAVAGDPVRIEVCGLEIEGRITSVASAVLKVKLKATRYRFG